MRIGRLVTRGTPTSYALPMRWRRLASRLPLTGVAASARTLAIIGLIVGALVLLAGIVALVRGRRSPAQAAPAAAPADTTVRQDR